ncbi:hypothetical protein VNI00_012009 [Paramarasmius palmivorus]|uniref:C2H2-type domain-containing protein n=1 Tax=Paramarasmius palmivorus TaxID=297713 RepID=A0AAW0CA00_9AGAR
MAGFNGDANACYVCWHNFQSVWCLGSQYHVQSDNDGSHGVSTYQQRSLPSQMMPYLNPPTSHNPMSPTPAQTSSPHAVGVGPQQSSMHSKVISTSGDTSVGGTTAALTSSGGQCPTSLCKFTCDRCGKGYTAKHNLAYHIRGHDGVKPFVCEYCEKEYRSLSDLRRHLTQSKSPCVLKHKKAQTGAK